jgi:hypothetical protein
VQRLGCGGFAATVFPHTFSQIRDREAAVTRTRRLRCDFLARDKKEVKPDG